MRGVKFNSKKMNGFINSNKIDHSITIQKFLLLFDNFLDDKKLEGLRERTIKDYYAHLKFFKKYLKIEEINELQYVDSKLLKGYIYYMQNKNYSSNTINIRMTTLKCFCNWLFKNGYTDRNYSLILKKVKTEEDMIQPLSNSDVRKMLAQPKKDTYAGIRDFTVMIVLLDTGIRINELVNTKINDIDIKEKLLHVRAEVCKTRKSRDLPLSKQSVFMLKQLIEISVENNSPYVFMSTNSCDKVSEGVIIRDFESYGKRAGIKIRCTPHVWRHTFCTNAVRAGIDIFSLQKLMGHRCISTTRKYVQLNTQDLQREHEKINFVDRYFKGGNR